jgi:hypothetical protein
MPFVQFQLRRGSAAEWASVNPILAQGEMGLETDTKQIKVGDGVNRWNSLQYGIGYNDLYAVTSTGNSTNVAINITNTAVSSNSVTGALTVAGGVGIGGNLHVAGNIYTNQLIGNTTSVTVGTSPVVVDQYPAASYRTAKYIVQATKNTDQHSFETLIINDAADAYFTVYASLVIGNQLLSVNSNISAGNVRLILTGSAADIAVKIFSTKL